MKNVCVMGLGYIGLPTAGVLANIGYSVTGVDVKEEVIDTINLGDVHIVEPDLDILIKEVVRKGEFKAGHDPIAADVYIIAVPTPFKNDYQPDISFIEAAIERIAPYLNDGCLIILESTSPVGTTEKIGDRISELRTDLEVVYIAYCPERVLPGQILKEIINNDRIVGGIDDISTEKAVAFYRSFVKGEVIGTNSRTAELAKLTENSFRDVNIAFANELSMICDHLDVDVWELISLANHHPRVNILQPGPGVGGHCIAIDPWFIVHSAPEQARLIKQARIVNDDKPYYVTRKIIDKIATYANPVIACFGLSFKANIDDLRESPALNITIELAQLGIGEILVVEPHIERLPEMLAIHPHVSLVSTEKALNEANIIVVLVDHDVFKNIVNVRDCNKSGKLIVDTRGIWK